jgi:hypothetical protein
MDDDMQLIAVYKGGEVFAILFNGQRRIDVLRQLGRWAANPELNFTWADAAAASKKVWDESNGDPAAWGGRDL